MNTSLAELNIINNNLITDEVVRASMAEDFGHVIHHTPFAVFQPKSIDDVHHLICLARKKNFAVVARGQARSTHGQSQIANGIVIDMQYLRHILEMNSSNVVVEAGITWRDLLKHTNQFQQTPPVLTGYIHTSVGGTLSVGGVGPQTFRAGTQTDNVLEMEVITGEGKLVTCSPTQNKDLFQACLAGLGQFGVIVKARIALVPAPTHVRFYHLLYQELDQFLDVLKYLVEDESFDGIEGFVVPGDHKTLIQIMGQPAKALTLPPNPGKWLYLVEAAKYLTPESIPDAQFLHDALPELPLTYIAEDLTYWAYANRLDRSILLFKYLDAWKMPHPWVNLILADQVASTFIGQTLENLTIDDLGPGGSILIFPYKTSRFKTPFFRVPEAKHVFKLGLLRTAYPPTPEKVIELLHKNRQLYEKCLAVGGTRYPIDSVPMKPTDWVNHFGTQWTAFYAAKQKYDPDGIMAPNQHIFLSETEVTKL